METGDTILDVDLLGFEQGSAAARAAVVDGVTRSLRTGFVYARHDIPEGVIDDAYGCLAAFFGLSDEEKRAVIVPGSMGQTGYTPLLVETAAASDHPDFKEMLNWGLELPDGHPLRRKYPHRYMARRFAEDAVPGITQALSLLWDRLLDLQRRVLRIVAVGIGCHAHFFDAMLEGGPTLCRALRYPPMVDAPAGGHVWAGAHDDINLITALPRATARGLQVRIDGGWVDAAAPAGHAILNTGMMLERLTNGVIPAGHHRVVSGDDPGVERYSVVQFCHPSPWTILSPVASCISEQNPQRDAPIEAGDWLDQVLYDINLVEDARRVPHARPRVPHA